MDSLMDIQPFENTEEEEYASEEDEEQEVENFQVQSVQEIQEDEALLMDEDELVEEEEEDALEEEVDEEPPSREPCVKRNRELDFTTVKNLANYLSKVELAWPENLPDFKDKLYNSSPEFAGYPRSYFRNTSKEKVLFWHAENFRAQFAYRFPDRRPLLIAPRNELGVQKIFSTYIKPRLLQYSDFFYAEDAVIYLRDFFHNDFLEPPTDPPKRIRSPFTVLKDRKANCYEHSIILATVLLGCGYNAFVVDGFAKKEITMLSALEDFVDTFEDQVNHFEDEIFTGSKTKSSLVTLEGLLAKLDQDDKTIEKEPPASPSKYKTRMNKHFISSYEEMMKDREEQHRLDEEQKAKDEALKNYLESLPPPATDPLYGFRIHSWVLILPGGRDVKEPFFLEPFSGTKRSVSDEAFLGIETVFNHKNFWVNLQDCKKAIGDLSFDLKDPSCWASLLVDPSTLPKEPSFMVDGKIQKSAFDDEEEEIDIPEMYLDMGPSWTLDLQISAKAYKEKFPGPGSKSYEYTDALVERAAPYSNPDGLLQKVIKFNGPSRKASNLMFIDERFDKRQDKLIRRKFIQEGRIIHEWFDVGRPDALKEHIFFAGRNKPHSPRHLYYHPGWHQEAVVHRQVIPNGLVEHFEGRKDRLIFREIIFGGVLCMTNIDKPQNRTDELRKIAKGEKSHPKRIILGIIEKYEKNPELSADEDVAERHILLGQGQIRLIYHYDDENYTRGYLEFFKPESTKILKDALKFMPENSNEFHVDPFTLPFDNYKKAIILRQILDEEGKVTESARNAEEEVYRTVNGRIAENWHHKLDNEAQIHKEDEEEEDLAAGDGNAGPAPASERESEAELETAAAGPAEEIDFVSPYLVWGEPEDKEEEICLKRRILEDARDRISRMAEYMITCFQEEAKELKRMLADGCSDRELSVSMNEKYPDCVRRAVTRLDVITKKFERFQAKAPKDYCNLILKVLQHPILNRFALEEKLEFEDELQRLENVKLLEFARKLKTGVRRSCCQLDYVFTYIENENDTLEEPTNTS